MPPAKLRQMRKSDGAPLSRRPAHRLRLAAEGNPNAFRFQPSHIPRTQRLLILRTKDIFPLHASGQSQRRSRIHRKPQSDLAASLQATIIRILSTNLNRRQTASTVKSIAIGGAYPQIPGVRMAIADLCRRRGMKAWTSPRHILQTMQRWQRWGVQIRQTGFLRPQPPAFRQA